MKFFRIFFACVFCVMLSAPVWGVQPTTVKTGTGAAKTAQSSKNVIVNDGPCRNLNPGDDCKTTGAKKAKCLQNEGKLTCSAQECDSGYYLWVATKTKKNGTTYQQSQGICISADLCSKKKACTENGMCDLNVFTWNGKQATDQDCQRTDCDAQSLAQANAETGYVVGGRCIITLCKDRYTLNELANTCEDCKPCQPTNAHCELKGSDGIEKCEYQTSCEDGFDNIKNDGQYNPSCSAKSAPVPKPEPEQKVKEKCPEDASGYWPNCACSDVAKTYSLASNTCEDIQRETPVPVENECQDGEEGVYPICCDKNSQVYNSGNNSCDDKPQKCTDADKAQFPHAKAFKFENNQCVPTACKDGFTLQGTKCISDKIKDAEEAYKNAKENEQSLANRTLTAATMATTGIGGMELAQGLAEQRADKMAAQDMEAYMATFQCKIGNQGGKVYGGGDKNITVPGTNQLIGLYQQYVDLAASLKERKEALGMKPGIESEVVLDKANMGLYNDESQGNRSGTYASLYRAAMGNEKDAAKLQEMQDTSKKRVVGGATAVGVGVVGGIIGNYAINDKKKVKDLSESEFNRFVSEQESSQKRMDNIKKMFIQKNNKQ